MEQTRESAMDAGVNTIAEVLRRAERYNFSLKLMRVAYIAGVQAYLSALYKEGRAQDASRADFDAHVHNTIQQLPPLDEFSFQMKLELLSRRLSADIALCNELWRRLVVNDQVTTGHVDLSDFQTASSIPETRTALLQYRHELLLPRDHTFGTPDAGARGYFYRSVNMIQKCDECIEGWVRLLATNNQDAWAGEPIAYAPASNAMSIDADPEKENSSENAEAMDATIENSDKEDTDDDGSDTVQPTAGTIKTSTAIRPSKPSQKKNKTTRPRMVITKPPLNKYWEQRAVVGGVDRFFCLLCPPENTGLAQRRQLGRHFRDMHGLGTADES